MARELAGMGGFTISRDYNGELICCIDDLNAIDGDQRENLPTAFFVGLRAGCSCLIVKRPRHALS